VPEPLALRHLCLPLSAGADVRLSGKPALWFALPVVVLTISACGSRTGLTMACNASCPPCPGESVATCDSGIPDARIDFSDTSEASMLDVGSDASNASDDPLGLVWYDTEASGTCHGIWTRVAGTSTFSATWPDCHVTATLAIAIHGTQVSVTRTDSSDGNNCNYIGMLSGSSVTGTYSCTQTNAPVPFWSATITK
jgi:hypothetical protein